MAIRSAVTRGFGNGTFSGTIALVTTRGYAIGEAAEESSVSDTWGPPWYEKEPFQRTRGDELDQIELNLKRWYPAIIAAICEDE